MGSSNVICHPAEVTFLSFPIKAGTRFSNPRGMQGWADLVIWLRTKTVYPAKMVTHPSTNRNERRVTLLIYQTMLAICHSANVTSNNKWAPRHTAALEQTGQMTRQSLCNSKINTNVTLTHTYMMTLQDKRMNTHSHTHLTALCPGLPRWASTRKVKPISILLKQQRVAVASAGPYASLYLAPDR